MPGACFTVSELARRYRVSTTTIYRLIDDGKLEHIRTGGIIQVTEEALETCFGSPPGPDDRYLTPSEAAGRTGVRTTAIYRSIRAGKLTVLRIGRIIRIPERVMTEVSQR
jgi:excisionase family DNA binding protein